jgi:hypothetical protein
MPITLYEASVTNYLQTLGSVSHILDRGLTYCREKELDPQEIVETRIYADMQPFRFQIQSVVHHSVNAVDALKHGTLHATGHRSLDDYSTLQTLVREAIDTLKKQTPEEINAREGAEVIFQAGELKLRFGAADFVMSFSLPNFHFHATTAYDILRSKGVPLGKRDYMGRVRIKR